MSLDQLSSDEMNLAKQVKDNWRQNRKMWKRTPFKFLEQKLSEAADVDFNSKLTQAENTCGWSYKHFSNLRNWSQEKQYFDWYIELRDT